MKKWFLLIISIAFTSNLFSQQKSIDSLQHLLTSVNTDTAKVNLLNSVSKKYREANNYDAAIKNANEALLLAKQIDFKKGIADSYENIGNNFMEQNHYEDGIKNNLLAFHIREELLLNLKKESNQWQQMKNDIARSYCNIGLSYAMEGKNKEALENYFSALKIYEEVLPLTASHSDFWKKVQQNTASCNNMIGIIYFNKNEYSQALKYYIASLKVFSELNEKIRMSAAYNNIANVYSLQKDYVDALGNYNASLRFKQQLNDTVDVNYANTVSNIGRIYFEEVKTDVNKDSVKNRLSKAMNNYTSSLAIYKKINNKDGMATCYENIGNVYVIQGRNKEALTFYYEALKICNEINNELRKPAVYYFIGEAERKMGNYAAAKQALERALPLSKKVGVRETTKDIYQSMSEVERATGNFKAAYLYYNNYERYKDSIYNEEGAKQIAEMKAKYENEKNEKENLDLKLDNRIKADDLKWQKFLGYVFAAAIFLLGITIFLIIRRNQAKSKAIALAQQNEYLKQQENTRQRISNDLHDEIGAGLTQISIICHKAETDLKKHIPIADEILNSISAKSQDLSESLSDLIWATVPQNATLSNLLQKIRTYTYDFISSTNINLKFNMPDELSSYPIDPEASRNIYLILKECLNNIVKHSSAANVQMDLLVENNKDFQFKICDDGIGFDANASSERNGIKSLQKRAGSIKRGKLIIHSQLKKGTTITVNGNLG